ncbi:MAG: hypothetical protein JGK17_31120 [Microcoleus sp. PH2017_10_PVI_O_A]|uniref:hypothetical protein n=1 Tax=unclassified Microcoleus TaxID=2642155 RepID=UPI001E134E02|nr:MULTISPECIES: hypothetical protein [unclassified Microcoleus]MCC3409912.1 hypothetical protein [Microcoleus sp. PH2017_10_PVI_O_A]MCC3464156.1 hypothetical protein [Microcoleus sp. PH2017_11_PCY_U_A]MCC3482501.1 hypothetical protein [Microcoleus sp. PH2017_12_PCY_D_A]MCC3532300.1 hypothetical protein [Microcoleus sp. PH2017_21_RUC_O_A]MCC3544597.1 hypothetical protein [Microcoleus sp. PH2017_22_RUC_O_B]
MSITVAAFSVNLPAGITLDPTAYPATSQAIKVLIDALDAFNAAQVAFNATAPAGTDVLALSAGLGNEQSIFWPPGQTTTTAIVRPKVYTLSSFQQSTVTEVYPLIG